MVPAGNKARRLSSVNHTTKIIHHHHHHHHHYHHHYHHQVAFEENVNIQTKYTPRFIAPQDKHTFVDHFVEALDDSTTKWSFLHKYH